MVKYNKFKGTINSINKFLNEKYKLDDNTTFGQALRIVRNRESIVNHYWDDLELINKLRNLIEHESDKTGPLAIPTDLLVQKLEFIERKLKNPDFIGSVYKSKVQTFDISTTLKEVLTVIKNKNYTQFPVFDGNDLVGMLTENGIATWLASKMEEEIFIFEDVLVKEIIEKEELLDSYKILEYNKSPFDAYQEFAKRKDNQGPLVILVSKIKNIRNADDIIGIITHWDLKDLVTL